MCLSQRFFGLQSSWTMKGLLRGPPDDLGDKQVENGGLRSTICPGAAWGSLGVSRLAALRKPKMVDEFKAFIMKGNVLDLAVGVIIGLAFSGVINSMVSDVIMPPIGLALGGADFSNIYVVLKDGPGNATPPYSSL